MCAYLHWPTNPLQRQSLQCLLVTNEWQRTLHKMGKLQNILHLHSSNITKQHFILTIELMSFNIVLFKHHIANN